MARVTALVCLLAIGCAGSNDAVTRIVDGRTLQGRFVEGDAYAAFLRGAVAESQGKWSEALGAYEEVRGRDDHDAEVWVRLARVRCAMKPGSGADEARRALEIDPEYGPAHEALAACGVDPNAEMAKAAAFDPKSIAPQIWLARLEGADRLVALSLEAPNAEASDALAQFAFERGQGLMAAHASIAAFRRDARMTSRASARAIALAGNGDLEAARILAGGLVDGRPAHAQPIAPLVGKLAVDEALARGDSSRAKTRAALAHVPLDVVAARAILLGHADIALPIASLVEAADPSSTTARATRIAAEESLGKPITPLQSITLPTRISSSAALVYGRALSRVLGRDAASAMLPHESALLGDALETQASVDLAARGILRDDELPLDAKLELALRKRVPFPEDVTKAAQQSQLDARHRLLFLAWTAPQSPETARLAENLSRGATRDALVGAALVRIAAQTNHALDAALRERLAASAPTDPIVFATLLDASPSDVLRRRLAAVAATKAERELSSF